MADTTEERNATNTLDRIRDGGQQLVFLAHTALDEIRTALTEGRFDDADDRARELLGKTAALSNAEKMLAVFSRTQVVRAGSLEVGMLVEGYGRADEVDIEMHECQSGADPHVIVAVKFATGTKQTFDGSRELLVTVDPPVE